jgi:sorbitol-specific phosphotransferase system component IIC
MFRNLCKTILKFPLLTQFFFKDNFQLYITKPFSKNKFKPKVYKQANLRCNLLTSNFPLQNKFDYLKI